MRTLAQYREIALLLSFGDEHSKAVKFFDDKIAKDGEDAEVIADESQMIALLTHLLHGEEE